MGCAVPVEMKFNQFEFCVGNRSMTMVVIRCESDARRVIECVIVRSRNEPDAICDPPPGRCPLDQVQCGWTSRIHDLTV
jgi:hypothetical protein